MTHGKSGARRGARRPVRPRREAIWPGLGALAALIGWGALVWAAIDFGSRARGGESGAWLVMAGLGVAAIACLFLSMMLVVRAARALGITQARDGAVADPPPLGPATLTPRTRVQSAFDPPPGNPYAAEPAAGGSAQTRYSTAGPTSPVDPPQDASASGKHLRSS